MTNIHATAELGCELDLVALAEDIPAVDPEQTRQQSEMRLTVELFEMVSGNGQPYSGQPQSAPQQQLDDFLDEEESGYTAHVRVYRSGKMCLTGVSIPAHIDATYRRVVHLFNELGVPIDPEPPTISNIVAGVDVGTAVDLECLMVDIGLEECEYNPVGFPGLMTTFGPVTVIVFHNGSVTVAGASTVSGLIDGVGRLQSFMADLSR
jgi:TATA-box binding protein (TBP) (component of TFIID and TFIIIB)